MAATERSWSQSGCEAVEVELTAGNWMLTGLELGSKVAAAVGR